MVNMMRLKQKTATAPLLEEVPLLFLGFLLADDDRRDQFMGQSGLSIDELKERLQEPNFKAFLLDYALSDEKMIIDFAVQNEIDPMTVMKARQKLPGSGFEM
jgi:Protein of unknown function (DUF3572)